MPLENKTTETYDLSLLEQSAKKWKRSSGLRLVYGDFFQEIGKRLAPGPSLELGSGIGIIKEFLPEITTSDLIKTDYVDLACSAYDIPRPESGYWGNIVAIDVLHHLCRPMDFFSSASQVLSPGSRIILIEPAATPFGHLFYGLFHTEPMKPSALSPPFVFEPAEDTGEFANMGMGVALFEHHRNSLLEHLNPEGLKVMDIAYRDFLAYPLTGGYSQKQMAPRWLLSALMECERLIPQALSRLLGLRMMLVLQKHFPA